MPDEQPNRRELTKNARKKYAKLFFLTSLLGAIVETAILVILLSTFFVPPQVLVCTSQEDDMNTTTPIVNLLDEFQSSCSAFFITNQETTHMKLEDLKLWLQRVCFFRAVSLLMKWGTLPLINYKESAWARCFIYSFGLFLIPQIISFSSEIFVTINLWTISYPLTFWVFAGLTSCNGIFLIAMVVTLFVIVRPLVNAVHFIHSTTIEIQPFDSL